MVDVRGTVDAVIKVVDATVGVGIGVWVGARVVSVVGGDVHVFCLGSVVKVVRAVEGCTV